MGWGSTWKKIRGPAAGYALGGVGGAIVGTDKRADKVVSDTGGMAKNLGIGYALNAGMGATVAAGREYYRDLRSSDHAKMNAQLNKENLLRSGIENRIKQAKSNINVGYGYLPEMSQLTDLGQSRLLTNRSQLDTGIERNAGLARDSAMNANVAGAEAGARNASFRAAGAGLTGSSMDLAGKRQVLGGYVRGRAGAAQSAMGVRTGSRNALESERIGMLGGVNNDTQVDYAGHAANMNLVNQLGQAASNAYPEALGSAIGGAGNAIGTGVLYQNMGLQGLNAFRLPSLSGGSKTRGGLTMNGTGAVR